MLTVSSMGCSWGVMVVVAALRSLPECSPYPHISLHFPSKACLLPNIHVNWWLFKGFNSHFLWAFGAQSHSYVSRVLSVYQRNVVFFMQKVSEKYWGICKSAKWCCSSPGPKMCQNFWFTSSNLFNYLFIFWFYTLPFPPGHSFKRGWRNPPLAEVYVSKPGGLPISKALYLVRETLIKCSLERVTEWVSEFPNAWQ